MNPLTLKGLKFIRANLDRLTAFAKAKIANGCEEDDWNAYNMSHNSGRCFMDTPVEHTVDVNVWLDLDTNKWKAGAYPMEINSVGKVQTNTRDFVELF